MKTSSGRVEPDKAATSRTVTIGGKTKAELLQEFRRQGVSMNALGQALFDSSAMSFPKSTRTLETIEQAVHQLGLPDGATADQLFAQAVQMGLHLCPLETAAFLRLDYLDQPSGSPIIVASPRPSERFGDPSGFYLRRLEDVLWLRGYTAAPEHVFDGGDRFLFSKTPCWPAT